MKKINLIERLWTDSHEKQKPQRFARYAVMLIMLLTLGVGQMWADPWVKNDVSTGLQGTKTVGDKLNGGSDWWYNYQTNGGWSSGTDIQVLIGTSSSSYSTVNASWYEDSESNKKVHANIGSFTFDKSGLWYAVGKYYASSKTAYTSGTSFTNNSSLSSSMSTSNSPYWKVNPPAVKTGTISISATNTAAGSGDGLSSGSPIILVSGMGSTLTITATQNVSDANSALWCKFGTGSYSATTTYAIASNTLTSNQTLALAVKYRNNGASLDGSETTTTIYYKWAAPTPTILMTSVTPSSSIVAGNDITLVGTRANSSNTISFQYTTNDGSTWTDITPKTSSLSSNVLTATWTVPDAHGATQTFKFRAKLAEASPIYSSESDGVTVYNTKTIHVKNSNNWGSMYVYAWDGSGNITSSWHGNTGDTKTGGFSCTSAGGQWWDVVITSRTTGFILNGGGSGDANQTVDLTYSTYTHDRCLAVGTGSGKKSLSNTAATCPSAPSVTTAAATSVGATSVQFNASSVSANNDAITDYGFKWGTTSACSGGTVTASNLSSTTFSATKSSLTNGTTYYFKAYATNGQGTTYGDAVSVRTKYITTVTLNPQGGENGTTEVTATEGSSMPTGKVAPTKWGYDFGGYYASAGGSGTKYYNANMSSANNWDVAASTATIHAKWTAKSCTISLNNQGADSGKEGTTSVSTTYNTNTNLTSDITCPTKTGWKFQGYWSNTNGNGVQVIAADGSWNSNVDNPAGGQFIDEDGKWVADGGTTLYAYWVKAGTYTFRYGTSSSEDWNGTAFTQVDATTTWQIENFTIPNKPNFYVGFEGLFYESGLGTGATKSKSVTRAWTDAPAEVSGTYQGQMVLLPAGPTAGAIGQATGATGTLKIYSDSKNHNLYVGFEPSGYGVTRASGTLPFVNSSGTWRETNVVTLNSSDASGNFQVKLKTSSSYVATSHGAAEAASAVNGRKITGDADIANGKKGVFQMWTDATANNFGLRFVTVHDVTFNMQGYGAAISNYTDVRYNSKISAPDAPSQTGYTFGGWYKEPACTNAWDFGSDVVTAATTLYAKWTPNTYTVTLDQQSGATGYGANGDGSLTATFDAAFSSATMPTAANGYAFMGYWSAAGGTGTQFTDASGNLLANIDSYSDASGNWIYDGDDLTLYAYYKKAEITDVELNETMFDPVAAGDDGYVVANPTIAPNPTGDHIICWELLYDNDNPVTGHDAIADPDGSHLNRIKFSIAGLAAGGYKIRTTLRTGSSCAGGTLLDTRVTTFQIANAFTVTVEYKDSEGNTIAASTTSPGKALESTDITAPDLIGYTFSTWQLGEGMSTEEALTTKTDFSYKTTFNSTLTAVYTKKNVIYFNNTLGWEDVWVYFYTSDKYWANDWGTGAWRGQYFTGDRPYFDMHRGHMTQIEGTDIWYFDYTALGWGGWANVAFTNMGDQTGQGANANDAAPDNDHAFFSNTTANPIQVVRRGDHKTTLPMFVPLTGQTGTLLNNKKANYVNQGYWMNYPENTGYVLHIYDSKTYGTSDELMSIPFEFNEDKTMPMSLTVELAGGKEYGFEIHRADGTAYGETSTMKSGASGDDGTPWAITSGKRTGLKTSVAGEYTFTLNYGNNGGYNYLVGVHYPVAANDYRIVYKDRVDWSQGTAHDASWYHPSRAIEKKDGAEDIVSFYVSKEEGASASMKFQYASAVDGDGVVTWSDVAGGSISLSDITESGVYNFYLSQAAGSITVDSIRPYTGQYYIRSQAVTGGWDNYRVGSDHKMTYSEFSESAANTFGEKFSHYKAKWCPRNTNIAFTIANDYSMCITDTLKQDVGNPYNNTDADGKLNNDGNDGHSGSNAYLDPNSANVRFMWNRKTNKISRAYVASSTSTEAQFLVLQGSGTANANIFGENGSDLSANPPGANATLLRDDQNWIYEITVQANPSALVKLYATYKGIRQYFRGTSDPGFEKGTSAVELLGGTSSSSKYSVRVVYDFKTNRLVTAWQPTGATQEIDGTLNINADVMVVRSHHEPAQCITFANDESALKGVKTVYGVMQFNRWILNNREHPEDDTPEHCEDAAAIATHHRPLAIGDQKSIYERSHYYISFPFDVRLSDVFGFGQYWNEWYIEWYDGLTRAKNGYWIDSPSNWKYVTPEEKDTFVLKANQGYILGLDMDYMQATDFSFWTNKNTTIELYFPSTVSLETLKSTEVRIPALNTIEGDPYRCTINRENGDDGDRRIKDSYWRCIGVPSFNMYNSALEDREGNPIEWKDNYEWKEDDAAFPFIYLWNKADNTITPQATSEFSFQPMHAYLVQNGGEIVWTAVSAKPSSIVARQRNTEPEEYNWRLELQQNNQMIDRTYIRMKDLESVTDGFDFGQDMSKEFNKKRSAIYSFIGTEKVAANSMTVHTDQTTIVPLGLDIKSAGEYVISLPEGTNGVGVVLVDSITGTRTNLGLMDYEISLTAGKIDNRFLLEISPIVQTPTDIEAVSDQHSAVRKVMIDGILYIVKDGQVFDARGSRVK